MTTDQPASLDTQPVLAPFDYAAWFTKEEKRRAAFADRLVELKDRLFDLLAAHGIVRVTVSFDGCGDSGQIEAIIAIDEHGPVTLPDDELVIPGNFPDAEADGTPRPLTEALELLAYDLLESEHGGWENDEGAFGLFSFDVADRMIVLDHNVRVTSAHLYVSQW